MTRLVLRWAAVACAILDLLPPSGDDAMLPRLSPASGASLFSCTEVAAVFRFPNTTVLSAEPVAAGASGGAAVLSWLIVWSRARCIGARARKTGRVRHRFRDAAAEPGRPLLLPGQRRLDGRGGHGPRRRSAAHVALSRGLRSSAPTPATGPNDPSFGIDFRPGWTTAIRPPPSSRPWPRR